VSKKRKKRIEPTQRLPKAQARQQYPIVLTEDEFELLTFLAIGGVRALTSQQICRLFYSGNRSKCNTRLLAMFQNSLVDRWFISLRKLGFKEGAERTLINVIDKAGVEAVASYLRVPVTSINWRPSDRTIEERDLRHLIPNNDIRGSIRLAVDQLQQQWLEENPPASKGYAITRWETDHLIRQKPDEEKLIVDYVPTYGKKGDLESAEIVPDDLFIISTPTFDFINLLELDTGSEVRTPQVWPVGKSSDISSKVRRYVSCFYKAPKKEGVGKEPSIFEEATGIKNQRGVRLMFIVLGSERKAEALVTAIRDAGGRNMYWVGRHELACREDLVLTHKIWRRASDEKPIYSSWIGSKTEEIQVCLKKYGVATEEIETRVRRVNNLAREQLSDGWNEREKGMSLEQAVALRADELAEVILERVAQR